VILWHWRRLSNLRVGIEGELQGRLNFSRRFLARVAMGLDYRHIENLRDKAFVTRLRAIPDTDFVIVWVGFHF
jgi:hypothetical protein